MVAFTLDELLQLERTGWDALCAQRGGTFYGELMLDEAVMVLVNGAVMDRATIAASLDQAPPWSRYELSEPRLVEVGEDASALVYRATATRDGEEPFVALMTSVYRRLDGRPRLALYTQTTITH